MVYSIYRRSLWCSTFSGALICIQLMALVPQGIAICVSHAGPSISFSDQALQPRLALVVSPDINEIPHHEVVQSVYPMDAVLLSGFPNGDSSEYHVRLGKSLLNDREAEREFQVSAARVLRTDISPEVKLRKLKNLIPKDVSPQTQFAILSALMRTYRLFPYATQLKWRMMIDLYENSDNEAFKDSDFAFSDYILALNRSAKLPNVLKALELSKSRISTKHGLLLGTSEIDRRALSELHIGIGTAYRNLYFINEGTSSSPFLEWSLKEYMAAFECDGSYYAGINVVLSYIFLGDFKRATKMAKLVKFSLINADTARGFWPLSTMFFIALVNNDPHDPPGPWFRRAIEEATTESEIDALERQLKRWPRNVPARTREHIRHALKQIGKLPRLQPRTNADKVISQPMTVAKAIQASTFSLTSRRGFKIKNAGIVPDLEVNPADDSVFSDLAGGLGLLSEALSVEEIVRRVQSFLGWALALDADRPLLSTAFLDRPLEDEVGEYHREIIDGPLKSFFRWIDPEWTPERGTVFSTATNAILMLILRKADCRFAAYIEDRLQSAVMRHRISTAMAAAWSAFNSVEDSGVKKDWRTYDESLQVLETLEIGRGAIAQGGFYLPVLQNADQTIRRVEGLPVLNPDPDAPLVKVDKHTFPIWLEYAGGDLVRVTATDAWYKKTYILDFVQARLPEMIAAAEDLCLVFPNAALVWDDVNNKRVKIDLQFRFAPYSKARQDYTDILRGQPEILRLFGQPVSHALVRQKLGMLLPQYRASHHESQTDNDHQYLERGS
jgi:hypothetical protein